MHAGPRSVLRRAGVRSWSMDRVSLVAWPMVTVAALVLVVMVVLVARAARRGSRLLGLRAAMWAVLATSGLALAVHAGGLLTTDIPRWYYAVALLPFVGPAVGLPAWRWLRPGVRLLAVVSLPIGLLVSGLVINQHYQYWPTLAALLGKDHTDPLLDATTVLHMTPPAASPAAMPASGRLVDLAIPGTVSGFHARTARVWLPPAFQLDPHRPRPVLLLIGGTPSWTSDWTRSAALDRTADRVAAANGGEAPLLVMVDANGTAFGDTECVGRSETYLTIDVPAYLAQHFDVPLDPAAWGVAGYSEGGTCAVTLAARHPDRFHAFVDLAGDAHPSLGSHRHTVRTLFGGSELAFRAHDPATLLTETRYHGLAGWFASGRDDGSARHDTQLLAAEARSAGVDVVERSFPGGHDYGFVTRALGEALPWVTAELHAPATSAST